MEKPIVVPTHIVSTDQRMKILPFIGIGYGFFMVLLDTTIVNVAGPAISHDLGGEVSGFQWVVSAYTLVFASLLLTAGALSDQFEAKHVFLIGLVIIAAVTMLLLSMGIRNAWDVVTYMASERSQPQDTSQD